MNYEQINKNEKLFPKLPKATIIIYLKYLLLYVLSLNKRIKLLEKEISEEKIKKINQTVNCPTSKLAEWENKKISTGKAKIPKKNKRKKRKIKKNKGSGNKNKNNLTPTKSNVIQNTDCPNCGWDLSNEIPFESISRIIEDIIGVQEKTIVIEEIQERVVCTNCKEKVIAQSGSALPKSDIGINTTVLISYLWVWMATSLPKISHFLNTFFSITISTAGISKMMIRVAKILEPVYYEILSDVKIGAIIHADETGWRVNGVLHWLWIFANKNSAFYWPDKSRGGGVVTQILGIVYHGLLTSDAWHAYLKLQSKKQTCMSHIFRKIRKLRDAFPEYYTILIFYERLKKIIEKGEKLQAARDKITDIEFQSKLKMIHKQLDLLLSWKNPNKILKGIIDKVKRQREYILTFIEHPGASPHNNYGEYIIKKGVLKRKVSGGSTCFDGLFAFSVLISIYQTCHLRKIPARHFIKLSLIEFIKTGNPMLLSEYQKIHLEK